MRNPAPYSIPSADTASDVHTITDEQQAHLALAITLLDHLDDLPSGEDGSRQEQRKDSLRAELDALLDTGADLVEFAEKLAVDA
jgi:hypothetical protein